MLKGPDESTEAPTEPAVQKKASSMNDIRSNPASPRIKKERVQTPIKKKTVAKEKVAKSVPVNPTEELHSRKSTADSDRFQQTCIFCDLEDDTFTEETLDLHYWKECPALTVCEHCRMVSKIDIVG
jgi:centrosomal protein CEP104